MKDSDRGTVLLKPPKPGTIRSGLWAARLFIRFLTSNMSCAAIAAVAV